MKRWTTLLAVLAFLVAELPSRRPRRNQDQEKSAKAP
jgi:hypothetical protein